MEGRREIHIGYRWESMKERDCYEDQDISRWVIVKMDRREDGTVWVY
jgi:hypothetical protein